MAHKRMFSLDIVGSDAFIEMPISTQALYFHLNMYADDDGFVSPHKILRMIGTTSDDLKVLLTKRFILQCDGGVVVVKHWHINNYVPKSRYIETRYTEQKKKLFFKSNRSYTDNQEESVMKTVQLPLGVREMQSACTPHANSIRSIEENRIEEKEEQSSSKKPTKVEEKEDKPFVLQEEIKKMEENTRRDINIVALYWDIIKPSFPSKRASSADLVRSLKEIKNNDLCSYSDEDLVETMNWLNDNADFKWCLGSVSKYITRDLAKIKSYAKNR